MEPVSPELVLVDPTLGERARSRLAEPGDTLARVDALIHTSRMTSLARRSMEMPRLPGPDVLESTRRISRMGRRSSAVFAGGVAAGALVVALLVGVRVDLRGVPAGADTAAIDEVPPVSMPQTPRTGDETVSQPRAGQTPPATEPPRVGRTPPATKPARAGRTPPATKPAPQRFAWAPTPGASAYHVELFRGSSKVFEANTTQTGITIPARWVFDRRSRSLDAGNYRWYVWPVASGRQAARAIVQARLAIPPR